MVARRFISLVALVAFSLHATGQDRGDLKYWVFFADKPAVAEKVSHVTPRALARRAARASRIPSDLDGPVSERYVAAVGRAGATPLVRSRWLNAVSVRMSEAVAEQVRALPHVREVRPVGISTEPEGVIAALNPLFSPRAAPGPLAYRLDYGPSLTQLELVNAVPGLEAGINGQGVLLGIIDTDAGDLTHPALSHFLAPGRLKGRQNLTGFDECRVTPSAGCDGSLHGQSVLSMAAGFAPGNLIGPAYGADLILAHTEYTPTETNQEEDNLVAGLEWMESQGVDVVNISLGYSVFDAGQVSYTTADLDGNTAVSTRAADLAAGLGVAIVASAGNEGNGAWFFVTSPADGDSVIAIGAVDGAGVRASFSGHGPTADGRIKPDVSAMGQAVVVASTTGFSSFGNGTSFSSPMVAGIVAQMLQINPTMDPIQVRDILTSTASKASTPDNNLGYGIVDAQAALAAAEALTISVETVLPSTILAVSAYPNPSTGPVTLEVRLIRTVDVRIEVFDILGRVVSRADWPSLSGGTHHLALSLPARAAGWYGYRVTAGTDVLNGALSLLD
jgi:serine protease AprX